MVIKFSGSASRAQVNVNFWVGAPPKSPTQAQLDEISKIVGDVLPEEYLEIMQIGLRDYPAQVKAALSVAASEASLAASEQMMRAEALLPPDGLAERGAPLHVRLERFLDLIPGMGPPLERLQDLLDQRDKLSAALQAAMREPKK